MGDGSDDSGAYDAGGDEGCVGSEGGVDAHEFAICFAKQFEFECAGLEERGGTDGACFGAGGGGCGDGWGREIFSVDETVRKMTKNQMPNTKE